MGRNHDHGKAGRDGDGLRAEYRRSGEAVYSACKGGIIAFTKTLARELARYGITVNCVCPGPTDMALFAEAMADNPRLGEALAKAIPLRRLGRPEDIAPAVAFLAGA